MAVAPVAPGPAAAGNKAAGAYRTIGELSRDTGLPQHILRYWETRFPQLRPLQRAGNRRYYRPEDVALVERIAALLGQEGYTIRGVQKALANDERHATPREAEPGAVSASAPLIREVRDLLVAALAEDGER